MTRTIRRTFVGLACVAMLGVGGWNIQAAALKATTPVAGQKTGGKKGGDAHPVLSAAIKQIEAVKDRLQKAPTDFGGHKETAIDALNHAESELEAAKAFDK
jgi:hypothetical protein